MRKYLVLCTISACLGGFIAFALTHSIADSPTVAQDGRIEQPVLNDGSNGRLRIAQKAPVAFLPQEQVNISVYENVNKSVVNIKTKSVRGDFLGYSVSSGSGSGSVLDKHGHVLTNYHVIEDARRATVSLFNGESYQASLVGEDPANDIAVLRIDAPADVLHPVKFGDSTPLRVGQHVYAIGNPFGLERTMTIGIISSLNRTIQSRERNRIIKQVIQIDAALNSGNSGGPLLNSRGEVIGMNTAIASPSGAGENTGIGFAVPVNTILRVVPQLLEHGRVIRPTLGITAWYPYEDIGLLVVAVAPDSPARTAGIQPIRTVTSRRRSGGFIEVVTKRVPGDLVTAIDGEPVRTVDDVYTVLEKKRIGQDVTLSLIRDSERVTVKVKLVSDA